MPPRFGILLVTGSHTHQENYAAAFAADSRCRLVALTDDAKVDRRRRDLNVRLAKSLDIPHLPDLDEALNRRDVHIVCICAEPDRRGPIAVRCARAGKHLYLDKSLAPSAEEAQAIAAAVAKAGVKSHMFSFIAQPWAQRARRMAQGKALGRLLSIHADTFFAKGRQGTAKLGTRRKEEFPPRRHQLLDAKRELDNCGVYPITLIRWLTGRRFRSVYALTANWFFAEHQKRDVEDFGLISAVLEDDTPVTIAAGRCGWTSHPGFGANRVLLVGSERTAVIDANRPRFETYTDAPPWTPPNTHPQDPMGFWSSTMQEVHLRPKTAWSSLDRPASDVAYFLDRLVADRDSELNAAEAAHATDVLMAAYRSASTGRVVDLPNRGR